MATTGILASIPHDLFTSGVPLGEKVIRTLAVYLGILLLLRLAGRRDLAQLNTSDLVVLLLLSNVVQNAVIGKDNSLVGGLLGAAVLLGANAGLDRIVQHSEAAAHLLEGESEILASGGRIDAGTIRRLGLRESDVMVALRRQGASSLDEVDEASLEPGGNVVVTLRPDAENATKADLARLEAKLDQLLARG